MKSRAHFKGHPIHPILVGFPVSFLSFTFLFDVLSLFFPRNTNLPEVAWYFELLGILTGGIAVIPGAIDYFTILPPKSSGKKRGTKHALLNISQLILFTVAFILRQNPEVPFSRILLLELAGAVIISIAGWMGGTLVYRNQIGVYNRFAHAGKWKEEYIEPENGKVILAETGELKTDQLKLIHANGQRIVLGKTENGYVAFQDRCTHRGGPLSDGVLICGVVQCPWHGSQFDVRTGQVKAGPAKEGIKTWEVKEEDGKVYMEL